MAQPPMDLNLLIALDALLGERSVGGAARRMHLSSPAMSRTLARIRKATGDAILVRTGRTMTPTPRALEIQIATRELLERAEAIFTPPGMPDLPRLTRTFSIVAADLAAVVGARLLDRIRREAPGVTLRLLGEGATDSGRLRDRDVDLEIGVIHGAPPDVQVEPLAQYEMALAVREGHPLARGRLTAARLAAAGHVSASRLGLATGPLDTALAAHGLRRAVVAVVPSHTEALMMVARSDLVGLLPVRRGEHASWVPGVQVLASPVALPIMEVSLAWHRRHDTDGAHEWLRRCVTEVITS
ncbi:LysR family transcriptional regulator [Actinoplanes sp. NEAU-A12]|uniref:LysR family transcriptional regulator n=1 Tax=Actinoplanes sandaracinus TaxID=3045177 RepID=A0ABT6WWM2_9ACTN|nr:LysR family transcriptional regulator [Actinoplanes sandaracinus]MDI6104148.1 LysR family transcriptional regulator [Actinoplanes sandaracinus]